MALGFRQRRRGVFGAQNPQSPSIDPTQGQVPRYGDMGPGMGFGAPQEQKRGLGTRLLGEGWEGKAAALGAMLQGDQLAVPDYMANQQALQQAAAQHAEAQRAAAAAAAQEDAQWYQREQWKRDNPMPANNDTANDYEFWRARLLRKPKFLIVMTCRYHYVLLL